MIPHALYCNRCRIRLSAPLEIRPAVEADIMRGLSKDGRDIAMKGVAYRSELPVPLGWMRGEHLNFAPQFWLNPDDRAEAVADIQDVSRLTGCCGTAGFHGRNQICRCKAEIGTMHEDCVGPRFFIPEPGTTTMRADTSDYWNYK